MIERKGKEPTMIDEAREQEASLNRRAFIGAAAVAGVALASCGRTAEVAKLGEKMVPGPQIAPDGPVIKAGLIGCGGRGTGAAGNFLEAGPNLEIVALADAFDDQLQASRGKLKAGYGTEVDDDRCYVGFDAYQKLIDSDVDYIILATPPHFRPAQFKAAVEARKNIFMEKPLAVDPVGARSIFNSTEKAEAFGLKIATGTQRRHERRYIETFNRVMDGAIGEIVAARCYWAQSQIWYKENQSGWSDMESMIRNWVNWCWLSGDHIVEQHIHNIDIINWFTNSHPVMAIGMGGRHRRVTGDQYDSFCTDYIMENGVHVQSMCRQIDGCTNNVSEFIVGSNGSTNCKDTIYAPNGEVVWTFVPDETLTGGEAEDSGPNSPYIQEHIDLVTAIRTDQPINEARDTAITTLTAIMGRISAYTGQAVTWDEMMSSELRLGPSKYALGDVDIEGVAPVPGAAKA